jgi:hypothetical protein
MFSIGPVELGAFIGTTNNNTVGGVSALNPYLLSGANLFIGASGFNPGATLGGNDAASGAGVGFPGIAFLPRTDDNEAAVHAAVNLFKIGGQPVRLGGTYLFDGVENQDGMGIDLTANLFNRTVGVEWVHQQSYANGTAADGHAFNVTVPILRMSKLDLDLAYGKASDDFEYFLASSANPFARTYGEALFDRPVALGAPMINGQGQAGDPQYMAAKKVFDVNGTVRIIKRLPLQFRYFKARGTDNRDLGHVWTVGSTINLTQGLDLEVKYGQYVPDGSFDTINYFRVGANVGF